jgi:hypothetical protein
MTAVVQQPRSAHLVVPRRALALMMEHQVSAGLAGFERGSRVIEWKNNQLEGAGGNAQERLSARLPMRPLHLVGQARKFSVATSRSSSSLSR